MEEYKNSGLVLILHCLYSFQHNNYVAFLLLYVLLREKHKINAVCFPPFHTGCNPVIHASAQKCLDLLFQRILFLFLLIPVFWGYLNPQVRTNNVVNSVLRLASWLSFKISLKDTSFDISKNSFGLYLSTECLLNFLSNLYIYSMYVYIYIYIFHHVWEKSFKFIVFTFLENALSLGIFTYVPPYSKLVPKFSSSYPRQKEITHPPRQHFFKNLFPQQQKQMEETMICFIKIQSENMKMTSDIRLFIFCIMCYFFKCDSFTVL